jgi:hypothetical protein
VENLFEASRLEEVKRRLQHLQPDSKREWGKMTAAQMLAHCSVSIEVTMGQIRPPRMLIGRIIGPAIKKVALREGEPMRRNSPTAPVFLVKDDRNFAVERDRLEGLIDAFAAAGPAGCTSHPHSFFGRLRPDEWGVLMYKHLDHHLRQFGV